MLIRIALHADAPAKPGHGQPCNGCGVCCAMERCPAAWLFLPPGGGRCPALEWQGQRYVCGLVANPGRHIRWLPARWRAGAGRWFARRIAAGIGCDCDAEVG